MVEHWSNKPRVMGSIPIGTTFCYNVQNREVQALLQSLQKHRSCGVMVSTLDFESSDPGSNPGRSFLSILSILYRSQKEFPDRELNPGLTGESRVS